MARKQTPKAMPVEVVADAPVLPALQSIPIEEVPAPKTETLIIKIGIDQNGADVDGAVSEPIFFELEVRKGAEPLDLATISGRLGRQMWSVIRHVKTKRSGFNMRFFVDNGLTADYSLKSGGKLKFTNPVNCCFAVLSMIAAQFDDINAAGFITGKFDQTAELNLLAQQIGVKKGNLPWESLEGLIDIKRKRNVKALQTEVKAALLN